MLTKRRRFKQTMSLQDRLSTWANSMREQADKLRPGPQRDTLLKKVRQADTASHLNEWTTSRGLQPPR